MIEKSYIEQFREELNQNAVLSDSYKDFLMQKVMGAQHEAFLRGVESGKQRERQRARARKR